MNREEMVKQVMRKFDAYQEHFKEQYKEQMNPIFEVYMLHGWQEEALDETGNSLGYPGAFIQYVGWYPFASQAINSVISNACDINENGTYDGAMIICRFPGIYQMGTEDNRQMFGWHNIEQQYLPVEEPSFYKGYGF